MHIKTVNTLILALFSASSFSTTQCPPDAPCGALPPEFKVAMYASIVAFPMACAKLDPANAQRYEAALSVELGKLGADDQAAMDEARRDPALPAMLIAASKALEAEQSPARLARKCSRALQRTEAAEPGSTK
ncbi:hypothetical protein [Cupriavidus basilensis]|uniref:hypothetical protein n=1 Tax=Cupriavidus basilensis TaxID=68895 RepID=UPI0039F70D51